MTCDLRLLTFHFLLTDFLIVPRACLIFFPRKMVDSDDVSDDVSSFTEDSSCIIGDLLVFNNRTAGTVY